MLGMVLYEQDPNTFLRHNSEQFHYALLTVEVTEGVGGGTSNIQPAMLSGQFDIYPEYTGTAWSAVLKRTEYV